MPRSDTPANDQQAGLLRATAEAVEELRAARELIMRQQIQIAAMERVIEADSAIIGKFRELRTLDGEEKISLRSAIDAKNRQIAALEEETRLLKRQRGGFWKSVKTALTGIAIGVVLGGLANH